MKNYNENYNNVNEENNINEINNNHIKESDGKFPFFTYDMKWVRHVILILVGYLGLQIIATVLTAVLTVAFTIQGFDVKSMATAFLNYSEGLDYIEADLNNYLLFLIIIQTTGYILTALAISLSLLKEHLINICKEFKIGKTYLYGLMWGAILITGQILLSMIINQLHPTTSINQNESLIRLLSDKYYIPMFIVTVFCAPIVEELTYRLGLLGLLNKKNKWLALFVSALIFALLHFNFDAQGEDMINELWNLPVYIYSGIILGIAYTRHGRISESIICHLSNNLFSMLLSLLPTSAIIGGYIL